MSTLWVVAGAVLLLVCLVALVVVQAYRRGRQEEKQRANTAAETLRRNRAQVDDDVRRTPGPDVHECLRKNWSRD
jgi:membrane protein implicated in regulation of membrane protease activity